MSNQTIEYMIEVVLKYYDPNKIPVEVHEVNISDLIENWNCVNDVAIKILKEKYQDTTFVNIDEE